MTDRKLFKPEPNRRWYCGPYVVALLTGKSFEQVRASINKVRGRGHNIGVTGMYTRELTRTLTAEGFRVREVYWKTRNKPRTNLRQWYAENGDDTKTYLVSLTEHFVLIDKGWAVDTKSKHPVHISMAPNLRATVKGVYEIN